MDVYVLRYQGVLINKATINTIESKLDGLGRTIGTVTFKNGSYINIENPSDYELLANNSFISEEKDILDFDYITFSLTTNYIDKTSIGTPVIIFYNNESKKNVDTVIIYWIASMIIRIKQLLGEK